MILSDLHYPFRIKSRNREIIPKFSFQWQRFALQQLAHVDVSGTAGEVTFSRPSSFRLMMSRSKSVRRPVVLLKESLPVRPSQCDWKTTQDTVIVLTHKHTQSTQLCLSRRVESQWVLVRDRNPEPECLNRREPGARPWKSRLRVTHDLHFCFLCKTKIDTYPPAVKFTGIKLLPQSEQEKH